jgi:hypothetical protein
MRVRKAIVWSILHYRHVSVEPEEINEAGLSNVLGALFPGITYSTTNAFSALMRARVKPALEKLFPDLLRASEDDVPGDEAVTINAFLTMTHRQWDDRATTEEFYQRLGDVE